MVREEQLRLIAITDHVDDGVDALVARAVAAVRGGATMLQVRLKQADARLMADVTRRCIAATSVPVIVNDRVDVALAAGAAGVHVGADDLPVRAIRTIVPAAFIVGASVGDADEADAASGADYVGIGPVFSTSSKADAGVAIGADGFAELRALVRVPAVGIGGITAENARTVRAAGAAGVAVIAGVFGAPDPEAAARELRGAMDT
ncbi:MAG TPA: thiamine phosphate synthase [Gemmatimonadaceae bacterium]|nr:thiamine phosphate synthase [Gemmatimonadaceae bacterium]